MRWPSLVAPIMCLFVLSCATMSDFQTSCETKDGNFPAMVNCLETKITSDSRARNNHLAWAYLSAARDLSKQVVEGRITESQARGLLAEEYVYLKAIQDGTPLPKKPNIHGVSETQAAVYSRTVPSSSRQASDAIEGASAQGQLLYRPKSDDFVDLTKAFGPNAVIEMKPRGGIDNDTLFWQSGSISGQPYYFYSDGSGTFGRKTSDDYGDGAWSTSCQTDKMDDTRLCWMRKGDLAIAVNSKGLLVVFVGSSHYPGTGVKIRIDGGDPVAAGEDGWHSNDARILVRRLVNGKKATTRYQKWPYENHRDKTIELDGLSIALRYIDWAVRGQHSIISSVPQ